PLETLSRHKHKRAENTWGTIKRIITYLMDYKWLLVFVIFMVLISSSMGLLGPYLVGMAIDDFIDMQKTDGLNFNWLAHFDLYSAFFFYLFTKLLDGWNRTKNCIQFTKRTVGKIPSTSYFIFR